jgi:RNA polymerase sigma-70 factor (ECF subfamily)
VYAALNRLGEKKRTVFVLFELEELSGEEIAALINCPVKTVWSRLASARIEFADAVRLLSHEGDAR